VSDTRETTTAPTRSETGQEIIERDEWADCWICEDVFRRRTQTKRYCAKCNRGWLLMDSRVVGSVSVIKAEEVWRTGERWRS
jgi:hypothetical protein